MRFLRVRHIVTITQTPSNDYPDRNKVLTLTFLTSYSASSTWQNLSDSGSLVLPKNLYYRDAFGKPQPLSGKNINAGGFGSVPLFLRGDSVTIKWGYSYQDERGATITEMYDVFQGFIFKVKPGLSVEFELKDNMFKLMQKPLKPKHFGASDTLESILQYLTEGTGFTVNLLQTTKIGPFTIGHETPAQVLQRLQRDQGLESYFRGNELRCGALIYVEDEAQTHVFHFEKNIIESDLEYRRKDDIKMSAIAHNTITVDGSGTTQDGQTKKKKKRIQALVEMLPNPASGESEYTVTDVSDGHAPENVEGERRTFFFPGAESIDELGELAYNQLKKYYYNGLKGTFRTFGIPRVKHGDNVKLIHPRLPEYNGVYKVKQVDDESQNGLRQIIELDYKINI
jgi:hypothetical protein